MKFSIILNSRNRVQYLNNLLSSLQETTSNLNEVEILISFDNDDINSLIYIANLKTLNVPIRDCVKFEFIEREPNLHIRLNSLAKRAQGQFIWVLNDDTEVLTKNWDEIAWNTLNFHEFNQTDGILYIGTSCNSADHGEMPYSSFPMISKKACEVLGKYMDERIVGLGNDVVSYRLYNSVGRVVSVPIEIRHIAHETIENVNSPDLVAHEMRMRSWASGIDPFTIDIEDDVEKLRSYINGHSIR